MSQETTVTSPAIVAPAAGVAPLLPLEIVDKCIGSRIWIILRNNKGV